MSESEHGYLDCELPETNLNGKIYECPECGREWFYEDGWFRPDGSEE